MSKLQHALYQITIKALLFHGDKLLVLHTPDGYLDFPGGRVDESERDIPWADALKREIAEELGESMQVSVGKILFVSKRQFHRDGLTQHVAAIFFECQLVSGEITLSEEHHHFEWLTPAELLASSQTFMSEDEKHQLQILLSYE